MEYFYKGMELYNVKELSGLNFLGHDIDGYYFDPTDNREKHGLFYLNELQVKELA